MVNPTSQVQRVEPKKCVQCEGRTDEGAGEVEEDRRGAKEEDEDDDNDDDDECAESAADMGREEAEAPAE